MSIGPVEYIAIAFPGNKFSGEIDWVQIDIGEDSHDHLITPEERLNIAMAKQ